MLRAKYNLNGHPSLKGATKMRVFCPEHKRGFFAPRQSPIKCENRGHLLGEIDFEGQATSPVEIQWQYCCNCEHFCPVDFDQYGLQRCPVCTRKSSLLYLCDRCHIISFESNTPLQTKNFTLTAEGAPQPSCPGCLRPASADLHEHHCDEINVSFVTGLSTCPACQERLDVAPAFPSLVGNYLKRTKSSNKVNVTFDYETGAFVPVEDGEFVVVINIDQSIVLPRATKFSAKRDFYEFYQDYYHCPNPDAGDVQIIRPALVSPAGEGWTLEATGLLEIITDQPKKRVVTPVVQPAPSAKLPPQPQPQPPVVKQREAEPVAVAAPKKEPVARPCPDCGAMIEMKYSFCWKCGHSMEEEQEQEPAPKSISNGRKPGTLVSADPVDLDDDELTIQHASSLYAARPAWTRVKTPERFSAPKGSVLKLIAIGAIALLLVSLGLFGLLRSNTPAVTATVAQPAPEPSQTTPAAPAAITTEVSRAAPTETTTVATVNPEDELKKLRERRLAAPASERSKVFQAFVKVEKQYPRDYRFPYERAKLAVKGKRASSRSEAFKALKTAAQKAITTGKANEMLSGLETDKSGDFSGISQGRYEWSRLVSALKKKDPSLLGE